MWGCGADCGGQSEHRPHCDRHQRHLVISLFPGLAPRAPPATRTSGPVGRSEARVLSVALVPLPPQLSDPHAARRGHAPVPSSAHQSHLRCPPRSSSPRPHPPAPVPPKDHLFHLLRDCSRAVVLSPAPRNPGGGSPRGPTGGLSLCPLQEVLVRAGPPLHPGETGPAVRVCGLAPPPSLPARPLASPAIPAG